MPNLQLSYIVSC